MECVPAVAVLRSRQRQGTMHQWWPRRTTTHDANHRFLRQIQSKIASRISKCPPSCLVAQRFRMAPLGPDLLPEAASVRPSRNRSDPIGANVFNSRQRRPRNPVSFAVVACLGPRPQTEMGCDLLGTGVACFFSKRVLQQDAMASAAACGSCRERQTGVHLMPEACERSGRSVDPD